MKLPTKEQAKAAIAALSGTVGGPVARAAAEGLVDIVVDLFDGKPEDQAELKAEAVRALDRADAGLDRLDSAIADRKSRG